MFTNRTPDGRNNICGIKVKELRKGLRISQHELSNRLIVNGLDIDKNAVQRIESGPVSYTHLRAHETVLDLSVEELIRR